MSHGEHKWIDQHPHALPKEPAVFSVIVIFVAAAAFAAVAFAIVLRAMLMIPAALFIGPHAFQAAGILIVAAGVYFAIAIGLFVRHVAVWWLGMFALLATSGIAYWADGILVFAWAPIPFLILFLAFLFVRPYYADIQSE
jgi:hypothetical protein